MFLQTAATIATLGLTWAGAAQAAHYSFDVTLSSVTFNQAEYQDPDTGEWKAGDNLMVSGSFSSPFDSLFGATELGQSLLCSFWHDDDQATLTVNGITRDLLAGYDAWGEVWESLEGVHALYSSVDTLYELSLSPGGQLRYATDHSENAIVDGVAINFTGMDMLFEVDNVQVAGHETPDPAPVPLPAAGFLLMAGLGALGFLRRRS